LDPEKILYGAPAKSVEDIDRLRRQGFDFAEIVIPNATARRQWWESGVKNDFTDGFFLIGHGPPVEEPYDDITHLWDHYLPNLMATVDTASRLLIGQLTIHMLMNSRLVSPLILVEKRRALKALVQYGQKSGVIVCLENLSESADELAALLNAVPDLRLTLDVGHAELSAVTNWSFGIIRRFGKQIRHVHLHDNRGGDIFADDLHLPVGEGTIDYPSVLGALIDSGYRRTMTLEVRPQDLLASGSASKESSRIS